MYPWSNYLCFLKPFFTHAKQTSARLKHLQEQTAARSGCFGVKQKKKRKKTDNYSLYGSQKLFAFFFCFSHSFLVYLFPDRVECIILPSTWVHKHKCSFCILLLFTDLGFLWLLIGESLCVDEDISVMVVLFCVLILYFFFLDLGFFWERGWCF